MVLRGQRDNFYTRENGAVRDELKWVQCGAVFWLQIQSSFEDTLIHSIAGISEKVRARY